MGRQIIKQPSGKFGVWSSVVDDFIYLNCDRDDLVNFFVDEKKKEIEKQVDEIINKLGKGEKPYFQFTESWEGALETIEERHGKRHLNSVLKYIE